MNLCVTGALGHIGSHLIRNLEIPELKTVYLVDSMETQRYPSLFDLPGDVDFVFKEIDIRDDAMQAIVADCDALVHLAAITDAAGSAEKAREIEETNKVGLEYVARLCADSHCSLLFPSTTSVYGSQSDVVDEDTPEHELRPQSPYAESKIFGERALADLGTERGLKFVVLRVGTIFGYSPGMRFHTAVNKFIWQAATGQEITVWRTAQHQRRPYCGLRDCCRAMNLFVRELAFENCTYNIVTANLTVDELVENIRRHIPALEVGLVDSPIMNQLSYEVRNNKSLARGITYHDDLESCVVEVIEKLRNVNSRVQKSAL